ncbi:ensconsin isoform X2 [Electrophorus electricus]|uniref:ensconsin isoform X2 n=1 Tax=Electrophorus electricus TaxID=8005 RepID=UPI0015D04D44|nr:ensconsin isoform X2 [Electrophorus electricus]
MLTLIGSTVFSKTHALRFQLVYAGLVQSDEPRGTANWSRRVAEPAVGTAIGRSATMPAPFTDLAGQQSNWRPAGRTAALSIRPEEGKKMDGLSRRQRGARPDAESQPERMRPALGLPVVTSVRIGSHGRNGTAAEPHALKVDERLRLARKRREEHLKQRASRERGWLAREERARRCYEQHLEERRKKLEEHRQREERRRMAVENKRRQRLKEERERYESVVRRTTERSQKAKQRVVNCSQRGGSGARSNTNAKRRLLSQWEVDLVSRLQTPTISYLARSRSAVCLSKGEAVHVCRRSASCHSVSSKPFQKLRQSCGEPPHRGVIRPGVNSPSIVGPGVKGPSIVGPGVNGPSIVGPGVKGPSIVGPGVNGPSIVGPGVKGPSIVGPGVNGPSIVGPGVKGPSIVGPGVKGPSIVGPGVNSPCIMCPGVNNPSNASSGMNSASFVGPGVNSSSQRASHKDQSHTAAAGVTFPSGTVVKDRTTPSTAYLTDKALIRAPLRQAPPKPEALPPLLEEEDPEPDCLLRPPQHQPHLSAALCLGELVLLKPGPAGPPFSPACPQTARALSLIGAGTQGGSSAGTTDPERASRLLAEKRRRARLQRETEQGECRQIEESERLARQIAVERVSTEARASQQQEERKRKKEEEQRKAEEEDARRQSEEEGTLRLQRDEEEARQRVIAEQPRLERERRFQREEAERQERKKRLEEIMKRTRKTDAAENKPASSSTTMKDILPNENVKPIPSLPLEDVIRLPSPAKASKIGLGSEEDLLPAVAFKERRSLRTLAGLEEIQAHQQAEVI